MNRPGTRRPWVQVNCAISADGRLAYAGGRRARLSGPEDLRRVQQLRSEMDGILVGIHTVLLDDPSLRVHYDLLGRSDGPHPTRIVLDSRGRIPSTARVLDGRSPTIIATAEGCTQRFAPPTERISVGKQRVDLGSLLELLAARGIRQLLVEGGAEVLASFFRGGYVDRFTVYVAPVLIGGVTAPTMVAGPESPDAARAIGLRRESVAPLDDGVLLTYAPSLPPSAPL